MIYEASEEFALGKAKVVRQSDDDQVTVVGAGVTLFQALEAHGQLAAEGIHIRVIDLFSVQPIDSGTLISAARATGGRVVTVEDHYAHGGIGDAVLSALATEDAKVHKLAVRGIARSGQSDELLDRFGISCPAYCGGGEEFGVLAVNTLHLRTFCGICFTTGRTPRSLPRVRSAMRARRVPDSTKPAP